MRKTLIYCLTPPKKVALEKYITNGLKQGSLHRSKAPDSVAAAQADVFQKNSDNKLTKIYTNMKIKR